MDRSFAARGPFAAVRNGSRRRGARSIPLGRLWGFIGSHRRVRLILLCVLSALALLGGGWLALRHSSLVSVEHVHISGVHGVQEHEVRRALELAGKGMSTLDVQPAALAAAVRSFPQVAAVHASASFPHTLRITVTEQLPVAVIVAGSQRTALAANGTVLGSAFASGTLPVIDGQTLPLRRVSEPQTRAYLTVLGAAPTTLDRLASRAYSTPKGLTVAMRNGLLVYFGDDTRPHAKWLSLARVLSDPTSAGASYVDVRLPERPAAGFQGSESAHQTTEQTAGLDPNSAALAQTLEGAITGTSSKTTTTTPATTSGESETQSQEPEASSSPSESPPTAETATATPANGG
jgi:cell division protein FtsQ